MAIEKTAVYSQRSARLEELQSCGAGDAKMLSRLVRKFNAAIRSVSLNHGYHVQMLVADQPLCTACASQVQPGMWGLVL